MVCTPVKGPPLTMLETIRFHPLPGERVVCRRCVTACRRGNKSSSRAALKRRYRERHSEGAAGAHPRSGLLQRQPASWSKSLFARWRGRVAGPKPGHPRPRLPLSLGRGRGRPREELFIHSYLGEKVHHSTTLSGSGVFWIRRKQPALHDSGFSRRLQAAQFLSRSTRQCAPCLLC